MNSALAPSGRPRESEWIWSEEHGDYYMAVYGSDGSPRYIWGRDSVPKAAAQALSSTSNTWPDSDTPTSSSVEDWALYNTPIHEETRPQHPSRSYSAPPITTQSNKIDVEVRSQSGQLKRAVALMDNGSDDYNWISPKLLSRLGLNSYNADWVHVSSGGTPVQSNTMVDLEFKLPKGGSYNEVSCYVWPRDIGPVPDILLGHPYLLENKILQVDLSGLFPGQTLWPAGQDEQAKQQAAEARRRQEQAALEQRRQSQHAYGAAQGTPNQHQTQYHYPSYGQ